MYTLNNINICYIYFEMNDIPEQYTKIVGEMKEDKDKPFAYDMDDGLMEYISDYISDKSNVSNIKLKEQWQSEYTNKNIPNWNVFFLFHFKSLNKCVIYSQTNHTISDGIPLSKIVEKMYCRIIMV